MQPRERERLREIDLTLSVVDPAGVHLDHDDTRKGLRRKPFQHLAAGLSATAGNQVLVLEGPEAVGEVEVGKPLTEGIDHGIRRLKASPRG